MKNIRSLKPDFGIQGGDHSFDTAAVPATTALRDFDLYQKPSTTSASSTTPSATTTSSAATPAPTSIPPTPSTARRPSRSVSAPDLPSFDQSGHHFIPSTPSRSPPTGLRRRRRPCPARLAQAGSRRHPTGTPIIVVSHVPLVSAAPQYTPPDDKAAKAAAYQALTGLHGFLLGNSREVTQLFEGHNVIAVLQGHTHINETVFWRDTPYITSGAVCGNWWKGTRWGTPEASP